VADGSPDRILRHAAPDRVFHWVTALCVLALMATGLLPVIGIKFPWILVHWIAGVLLTLAVLFHLFRSLSWRKLCAIWVQRRDLRGEKAGKYTLAQKLMHHAMTVMVLLAVVTGLPMMVRIDTPFWERNPYLFAESTWGVVYVLHGLASLLAVTLVMIHIYFGLLPEYRHYLRAMWSGWISRADLAAHHDPARWPGAPR
jgi:cytochrome b subunit of formate dehydrogenase